jgi:hypothetical protein
MAYSTPLKSPSASPIRLVRLVSEFETPGSERQRLKDLHCQSTTVHIVRSPVNSLLMLLGSWILSDQRVMVRPSTIRFLALGVVRFRR